MQGSFGCREMVREPHMNLATTWLLKSGDMYAIFNLWMRVTVSVCLCMRKRNLKRVRQRTRERERQSPCKCACVGWCMRVCVLSPGACVCYRTTRYTDITYYIHYTMHESTNYLHTYTFAPLIWWFVQAKGIIQRTHKSTQFSAKLHDVPLRQYLWRDMMSTWGWAIAGMRWHATQFLSQRLCGVFMYIKEFALQSVHLSVCTCNVYTMIFV